uniref:Uncharacterized protein n=1 Tax=Arundo donax TaxID=35708 RepID=A0A0A9EFB2_ARUDO
MGAHRHTRVNDAATFSDDDLRSFPGPAGADAPPLPEAAVTPDAVAAFVGPAAGCFRMRRSTSTARWYHGDFLDDRPDLAPPSFLGCCVLFAIFCISREWRNIWADVDGWSRERGGE